jgi:hypothetical protein
MSINCWEFHGCGCQPGGKNADLHNPCPIPLDEKYDGINNGKNAGRYCWKVIGTMSDAEPKCTEAMKIRECTKCDFFQLVKVQQRDSFIK